MILFSSISSSQSGMRYGELFLETWSAFTDTHFLPLRDWDGKTVSLMSHQGPISLKKTCMIDSNTAESNFFVSSLNSASLLAVVMEVAMLAELL